MGRLRFVLTNLGLLLLLTSCQNVGVEGEVEGEANGNFEVITDVSKDYLLVSVYATKSKTADDKKVSDYLIGAQAHNKISRYKKIYSEAMKAGVYCVELSLDEGFRLMVFDDLQVINPNRVTTDYYLESQELDCGLDSDAVIL